MSFEHEFFKLASVWLECRQEELRRPALFALLGQMDYHTEMRYLIEEQRAKNGRSILF